MSTICARDRFTELTCSSWTITTDCPWKPLSAVRVSRIPPPCARWDSDRAWFCSPEEIRSVEQFLSRRLWSFRVKGITLFSGYSQTWAIILATIQYARGRVHKDVLSNGPAPNWARSGQDTAQERALTLDYELSPATVIGLLRDLQTFIEDIATTH